MDDRKATALERWIDDDLAIVRVPGVTAGSVDAAASDSGRLHWAVRSRSFSWRRWAQVPHCAVPAGHQGGTPGIVVLEECGTGRLEEFLAARGTLRAGETVTVLTALLRAAGTAPGPPAGTTRLSARTAVIRATGEPVLLPGMSVPGAGTLGRDCLALLYRMLTGQDWMHTAVPLGELRPGTSPQLLELVAALDTQPLTAEEILSRLSVLGRAEPLALLPAVPGTERAAEMTAQIVPGSVLAQLRQRLGPDGPDAPGSLAGSSPRTAPDEAPTPGSSSGARDARGPGRSRRRPGPGASRSRLTIAGGAVLLILGAGVAAAGAFRPGADAASPVLECGPGAAADDPLCALQKLTALRESMVREGRPELLDRIAVPGSPAYRQDARLLSRFADLELISEPEIAVEDLRLAPGSTGGAPAEGSGEATAGGTGGPWPENRAAVVCATALTGDYRYRQDGVTGRQHAVEEDLTFHLVHTQKEGWRVERIESACPAGPPS